MTESVEIKIGDADELRDQIDISLRYEGETNKLVRYIAK